MSPWVRRALTALAAVVALVAGGIVGFAPPASAASKLTLVAGYSGGDFRPGHQVPVRVVIEADRLIRGTLQVHLEFTGVDEVYPVSVPVDISGGTTKEILVALPTLTSVQRATVVAGVPGAGLSAEVDIAYSGDVELVGLLSGVTNQVPQPLALPADLGSAHFEQLDDAELTTVGALDPLGTVVTGPEGLAALSPEARSNVLTWVGQGGHLVVDAVPGGRIDGLPEEWQPNEALRLAVERGEVRWSGGAAAAGRWDEVVEPTPLALPGDVSPTPGFFGPTSLATVLGNDSGLRLPTVRWLLVFLAGYVLLVGPALFVTLRRGGRRRLVWVAIPAIAVIFAAGAFAVGSDLRAGGEAAHGTIVHTGPGGARAETYVGMVSRSGEDGRALFPAGWSASGLTSALGDVAKIAFPQDPSTQQEIGMADVSLGGDATLGEIGLDPGGFGLLTGWGPLEETKGLAVTAVAGPDGSVGGTIRNDTDLVMEDVLVMVAGRAWGGQDLAPGEEIQWSIDANRQPSSDVPEGPWSDAVGFDTPNGLPSKETPVGYTLWTESRAKLVDSYPPGLVVAAGWTRAWSPPVDVDGPIEAGRAVFTTEAVVQAAPGSIPDAAVRREYLRGSGTTPVDKDRFKDLIDSLGADFGSGSVEGAVLRFTLPPGADPTVSLEADLPPYVVAAEAWDGSEWLPLDRYNHDGDLLEATPESQDPYNDANASTAPIPPEMVRDGMVYLRLVLIDSGGGPVVHEPTVGAAG
jgi:hypothetical protein